MTREQHGQIMVLDELIKYNMELFDTSIITREDECSILVKEFYTKLNALKSEYIGKASELKQRIEQ